METETDVELARHLKDKYGPFKGTIVAKPECPGLECDLCAANILGKYVLAESVSYDKPSIIVCFNGYCGKGLFGPVTWKELCIRAIEAPSAITGETVFDKKLEKYTVAHRKTTTMLQVAQAKVHLASKRGRNRAKIIELVAKFGSTGVLPDTEVLVLKTYNKECKQEMGFEEE